MKRLKCWYNYCREPDNRPEQLLPDIAVIQQRTLVFQNVQSLSTNHKFIKSDSNILAATILLYVETHCCSDDEDRLRLAEFPFSFFNVDKRG